MAPVGMDGVAGWVSSPEVGIIFLVAFLILSITLLALCTQCRKSFDPNDPKNRKANENTNGEGLDFQLTWRDHKDMPPSSLKRPQATNEPVTLSPQH